MHAVFARRSRPRALLIGAVPPPAIGPYLAMSRFLRDPFLHEALEVDFLDISDHRPPVNIGKFDGQNLLLGLRHSLQCVGKLLRRRHDVFYLGISQGTWGFLRDLSFILPALLLRRPVVLHLRGSEFRTFYEDHMPPPLRLMTRWALRRTNRMIVLGNSLKPVFAGLVPQERLVSIPNGIAWREFARAEGKTLHDGKRILFLSSLMKRKGLFLLLEAMALVRERHPEATLTVAGLWQSDEEEKEAGELIARLELEPAIRFVGEKRDEEKVRLFHEHEIFAFPPVQPEGLPWVLLEAMSASLPVVTTDQGAIADVVEDGSTGFLVEQTPRAVADAIDSLLEDPGRAVRMGGRGRERVETHFSERRYLTSLVQLLREVAEEAHAPKPAARF